MRCSRWAQTGRGSRRGFIVYVLRVEAVLPCELRKYLQIDSSRLLEKLPKVLEAMNASHSDAEPALTLLQSALSMSLPAARPLNERNGHIHGRRPLG